MAAKDKAAGGLVTALVAPRKTVMFKGQYVGPGGEVNLPEDEVAELRVLGFLVDPDAPDAPEAGDGPTFDTEGGAGTSVTSAA